MRSPGVFTDYLTIYHNDLGTYRYACETPCTSPPDEGDGSITFPSVITAKPGDLVVRHGGRSPFTDNDWRLIRPWEIIGEVSRSERTAVYLVKRRPPRIPVH